jgi:tetratricopeptide (TPR) repeat protein
MDYVLMLDGDYAAALEHARTALRLGLAAGSTADVAHDLNSIGWCHARMGRHIEALVTSRLVLRHDLVAADGNELAKAMALDTMGSALHGLGQLVHAKNVYGEAIAILRRIESPSGLADSLDSLGNVEAAMGRSDTARALWAEAAELLERLGRRDSAKLRAKIASAG